MTPFEKIARALEVARVRVAAEIVTASNVGSVNRLVEQLDALYAAKAALPAIEALVTAIAESEGRHSPAVVEKTRQLADQLRKAA